MCSRYGNLINNADVKYSICNIKSVDLRHYQPSVKITNMAMNLIGQGCSKLMSEQDTIFGVIMRKVIGKNYCSDWP